MTSARTVRIVSVICLCFAPFTMAEAMDHLLVSEIVVTPSAGEYVEIFNPTGSSIDLTDIYLTDATRPPENRYYYQVVTGDPALAGGGADYDFHARFPFGASIGPAEYQTISVAGSESFYATYGVDPTYELFEDGDSPDAIPDMLEALAGSIDPASTLSNSGEVVIIYRWDGTTDLVTDIDYVLWGDKAEAVDKTGVSIDGPDSGTTPSVYLADTAIAIQDIAALEGHDYGDSFTRIDPEEGGEVATGGNGLTGNDETSEDLSSTFAEEAATPNGGLLFDLGLSIDDVSVLEGHAGTTIFTFTVSLTEPAPSGGISYDITTADDTATQADFDYDSASDSQEIAEGESSEVFHVVVNGDLDGEINERFLVRLSNVSGTGAQILDGEGIGTILNDDPVAISLIQGAGESSPLEGSVVTTPGNVITAVGPEGFFIQTPDGSDDGDPDTSEGIYVYTGSPSLLVAGDEVEVTGTVVEFYDFTQIEAPSAISQTGTWTIPAPLAFDGLKPSPDPWMPSCAIEYECHEGMLITAAGNVVGPTQYFGSDPAAEFHAIATMGPMPFRGIGAEYPGMIFLAPTVPIFDGNPEIFEVDPDKLGLSNVVAKPGDTYTATGPLGYEYGGWEIWASAPVVVTPGPSVVKPVRPAVTGEMTVASLNMYRFYDDVDDSGIQDDVVSSIVYQTRKTKFRRYILDVLGAPDVIGLQEIEKLDILTALAADIQSEDPSVVYTGHLIPGNNIYGMNVGYLVRDTVQPAIITQLGLGDTLEPWGYSLFDHPPLMVEGTWVGDGSASFEFAIMNNHTRSLGGVDEPYDDFARQKRFQQAQSIAQKVQDFQTAGPNAPLVLVGDYNAFQFTDGYVDVLGQIRGEVDPTHNYLSGPVITNPILDNEITRVPGNEHYSYLYRGTHQVFDHALSTLAAQPFVVDQQFGRGNADSPGILITDDSIPDRSSDHDGMVLYLNPGAVLFTDGFESGDTARWSSVTP